MKTWFTVFGWMVAMLGIAVALIPLIDIWFRYSLRHNLSGYRFLAGYFLPWLLILPTVATIISRKRVPPPAREKEKR